MKLQRLNLRPSIESAYDILSYQTGFEITMNDFAREFPDKYLEADMNKYSLGDRLKINATYKRCVDLQREEMEEIRRDEQMEIPIDLDYTQVKLGLSREEQEKLMLARPGSIAAASRIPGITPNAVLSMLKYVKKKKKKDVEIQSRSV